MVRYLYICCAGHSGSTLLDLLLGSHSKIESLGEIYQLSKCFALNTPCSCGLPTQSCARWQGVADKIVEGYGIDVRVNPYDFNLGQPKAGVVIDKLRQTRSYLAKRKVLLFFIYLEQRLGIRFPKGATRSFWEGIDNSFELYNYVRELSGAEIIVDSSKAYLKAVGAYLRRPEETRLIILSRDGRGVLYSNLKRRFARRSGLNGWKNYYARALPLFDRNVPEQHKIRVKYENLVANPAQELRRICEFVGLEFEENMLDFGSKEHHIVAGNNMRFRKSSAIYADFAWQRELTEADRKYFMQRAGKLNRRLGYE